MNRTAVISDCGLYRYSLTREWGHSGQPSAVFIMLNPSTADAEKDDATIRKCIGFAKLWGCGRLVVGNLFAVRATNPKDMLKAADPVGPDNRDHLERICQHAGKELDPGEVRDIVVCAWGNNGAYMDQDKTFLGWLDELLVTPKALRISKDGHPGHPLYIPYGTELVEYEGRK